jgi:hypothetical protein
MEVVEMMTLAMTYKSSTEWGSIPWRATMKCIREEPVTGLRYVHNIGYNYLLLHPLFSV